MIETPNAINNMEEIMTVLLEKSNEGQCGNIPITLLIGTNDLTEDLIGIGRQEDAKILQWMNENDFDKNPFVISPPILREALMDIMVKANKFSEANNIYVSVKICGEHASHLPNLVFFEDIGIDGISVSSTPSLLEGLPMAHHLSKIQNNWLDLD